MVICHSKKCIFIHIPKTAGTSIEQFIRNKGKNYLELIGVQYNRSLHHLTAHEIKKMYPYQFNIYYKFAIIRNPYDRLLSEYYWTPVKGLGYKSGKTKADFLYNVINIVSKSKYSDNIYFDHFIPQHMFVYEGKNLLVDQLFKFESLDLASTVIQKNLDIHEPFPVLNKTDSSNRIYWTQRQKEKIYELYKKDFIMFNYEK